MSSTNEPQKSAVPTGDGSNPNFRGPSGNRVAGIMGFRPYRSVPTDARTHETRGDSSVFGSNCNSPLASARAGAAPPQSLSRIITNDGPKRSVGVESPHSRSHTKPGRGYYVNRDSRTGSRASSRGVGQQPSARLWQPSPRPPRARRPARARTRRASPSKACRPSR